MEDAWEISPTEWTIDDLEALELALERGFEGGPKWGRIKQLLGRLVTNRTAEEIGKYKIGELNDRLEKMMETVNELAVPKENATP